MNKIKDIVKKYSNLFLPIYVILNILYVIIGSYFYVNHKTGYINFSKGYIPILMINICLIIIMFIYKIIKKKKLNLNIIDFFLVLIIIFSFISIIFAKKIEVALYGMPGRYEGIYQIIYYFSVYFLTTYINPKYKKIITYTLLISILIETIYAYFQVTNIGNIARMYHKGKIWATGFTSNPNFFGTLTLIGLSISLGFFITEDKIAKLIIFSGMIFILTCGLLISNTMSVVVGLLVTLIYIFIYSLKKKKIIKFLIVIVILLSSIVYIASINKTTLLKDIIKTKNETEEIIKGNIDGEYGTKRIFIWTNTLKIVPKYLITGVGIDNFYYAFGSKPLSKGRWFFDKAHNEYLQILITEGIFSLISYLTFFGIITIKAIKESYKNNTLYLVLPVIGYLVQAFFNISVIEVAPLFYIALGLCVTREQGGIKNEEGKRNIPVHNSSKYLKECIDSVINQTYKNLEIIIIDDKSTDKSIEIIKKYKDSRIKLIRLKENSGAAIARNKGIDAATGDYICFLDSDDYWYHDKIEKQLKFTKNKTFIYSQYLYLRGNKTHIAKVPKILSYEELLKNTAIFTSTVMLNMHKLKKQDIYMPNIKRGQDAATWFKIIKKTKNAYGMQEVLSIYRVGEKSLSSNKFKAINRTWNLYKRENLSLTKRINYFIHYAYNAVKRRI